jgi:esterase/lipase superfamily enzyme
MGGANMKRKPCSCLASYLQMALLSLCLIAAYGCAGAAPKAEVLNAEKEAAPPKVSSAPARGALVRGGLIGGISVATEEAAPAEVLKEALEKKDHYRTVWYGTNRKRDGQGPGYTDKRDNKVHYGKLTVFVPKSHQLGSIRSPHWYYRVLGKDRMKVEWEESVRFSEDDFVKDIRKELDRMQSDEKMILVYIHGYNVNFEKAAIRTAQLSEDLSINGIAAFYSWPSKGDFTGYLADEATVEASEGYLYEFLSFIADKQKEMGARNVHIIAHSMGNRALLRAMNRLEAEKKGPQFGKIFLAAPDVDSDVFESLAKVFPKIASGTTLYLSPKDVAMKEEAKFIHKDFRVGYPPPVTIMKGIETVSFEGKTDLLHFAGHLYYADSIVVLCHLYEKVHGVLPTSDECKSMSKIKKTASNGEYIVIK